MITGFSAFTSLLICTFLRFFDEKIFSFFFCMNSDKNNSPTLANQMNESNIDSRRNHGYANAFVCKEKLIIDIGLARALHIDYETLRDGEILFAHTVECGILFFFIQIGNSFLFRIPYESWSCDSFDINMLLTRVWLRISDASSDELVRIKYLRLPLLVSESLEKNLLEVSRLSREKREEFYRRVDLAFASSTTKDSLLSVDSNCRCVFRKDGSVYVG